MPWEDKTGSLPVMRWPVAKGKTAKMLVKVYPQGCYNVPQRYAGFFTYDPKHLLESFGTTGLGTCVGLGFYAGKKGVVAHFDEASGSFSAYNSHKVESLLEKLHAKVPAGELYVFQPLIKNYVKRLGEWDVDTIKRKIANVDSAFTALFILLAIQKFADSKKLKLYSVESSGFFMNLKAGRLCVLSGAGQPPKLPLPKNLKLFSVTSGSEAWVIE